MNNERNENIGQKAWEESGEAPAEDASSPADLAFERDLRAALSPLNLPTGFADRMEAMVAPPRRGKLLAFPARRVWMGGAVAAALLAGTFVTQGVREHREQMQRQVSANQQFETAARITDQALAHTRDELQRRGALAQ